MGVDPYSATCPVCGAAPGANCVAVYEHVGHEMPAPQILRFEAAEPARVSRAEERARVDALVKSVPLPLPGLRTGEAADAKPEYGQEKKEGT